MRNPHEVSPAEHALCQFAALRGDLCHHILRRLRRGRHGGLESDLGGLGHGQCDGRLDGGLNGILLLTQALLKGTSVTLTEIIATLIGGVSVFTALVIEHMERFLQACQSEREVGVHVLRLAVKLRHKMLDKFRCRPGICVLDAEHCLRELRSVDLPTAVRIHNLEKLPQVPAINVHDPQPVPKAGHSFGTFLQLFKAQGPTAIFIDFMKNLRKGLLLLSLLELHLLRTAFYVLLPILGEVVDNHGHDQIQHAKDERHE
mmetsp:Transcript_78353/g.254577  ORF Transcript_78353/g.254577 Transcript_78353/m.254577 type:complete len:259 (-) Transcript_78353:164-940(-)